MARLSALARSKGSNRLTRRNSQRVSTGNCRANRGVAGIPFRFAQFVAQHGTNSHGWIHRQFLRREVTTVWKPVASPYWTERYAEPD